MIRRLVAAVVFACAFASATTGSATAAVPLPGFHSPSGNITCLFLLPNRMLLCSIAHASYAATLQDRCLNPNGEKGAGVDWHGWSLSRAGKGSILCSGGILYDPGKYRPSYVTLPYGRSMSRGDFTCWSRITGVTCRNRHGHGLFVSRESWRVW
jgi:hypothetical protein